MRIHRVHTHQALEPGREVVLQEGTAHYLGRVLRLKPGEEVGLFDGRGREWQAHLASLTTREATAEIVCSARPMAMPVLSSSSINECDDI